MSENPISDEDPHEFMRKGSYMSELNENQHSLDIAKLPHTVQALMLMNTNICFNLSEVHAIAMMK